MTIRTSFVSDVPEEAALAALVLLSVHKHRSFEHYFVFVVL